MGNNLDTSDGALAFIDARRRARTSARARRALIVVPDGLRALLHALDALAASDAAADAALAALDRLAARFPAACAPFVDDPAVVQPAQRALLLLGGRPARADASVDALAEGLRRVDQKLFGDVEPAPGRAFSRLLEAALAHGDVITVSRIDARAVDDHARCAAFVLEDAGRELSALDDLGHALGTSTTLAAGAAATRALMRLAADRGVAGAPWDGWLRGRGVRAEVAALVALHAQLHALDERALAQARAARIERPFALWVLASRLARGARLDAPDRAVLDALLAAAGLQPVEVFDAAALWQDLDR